MNRGFFRNLFIVPQSIAVKVVGYVGREHNKIVMIGVIFVTFFGNGRIEDGR